jgi:hypothetical protein
LIGPAKDYLLSPEAVAQSRLYENLSGISSPFEAARNTARFRAQLAHLRH